MKISLAPLQGYTEYPFRNALSEIIGGVDKYYSPFIRFENDGSIRKKHINDILPENNKKTDIIPQILVNNAKDFLKLSDLIEDLGYSEINWNLGCPFPMVAKRKLGSGLLAFPKNIYQILEEVIPKTKLSISIKLRSGYNNDSEINRVIEVLNQFSIYEVIYHPRIGKQQYKGHADIQKFIEIHSISKNETIYNGDIDSIKTFQNIQVILPNVNSYMIGRGLISNPFLAREIKDGKPLSTVSKRELFSKFHNYLLEHYKKSLSGDTHILNKFTHYWEFFSCLFADSRKINKTIKKCKSVNELIQNTDYIINNKAFLADD